MARDKKSKKKGKASSRQITVDMTNVEVSQLIPENDYPVKVEEVTLESGQDSGKDYLKWKMKVAEGEYKGSVVYYNTSLQPQSLFNLKNMLICLGVEVPSKVMNLNLDKLQGLECGITIYHEIYDGKKQSKVGDIFPLTEMADDDEDEEDEETEAEEEEESESGEDEDDDDEDDDDEDDDDEDDDDEEEEEIDLDSMNLKELVAFAKEQKIKLTPKEKKNEKKARKAIVEALS